MPINRVDEDQMVQECFDGDRPRNCDYCPAHYAKNGDCCFGYRFESHDSTCSSCIHTRSCEVLTQRKHQEERRYQPAAAYSAPAGRVVLNRRPGQQQQPGRPAGDLLATMAPTTLEPFEVEDDMPFFKQMGLHAAWGAVEGMLEMLLGFFRRRRPD